MENISSAEVHNKLDLESSSDEDKKMKEFQTYDDLLYHPCEDESNAEWVNKKFGKEPKNLLQISCAKCFNPLSYAAR